MRSAITVGALLFCCVFGFLTVYVIVWLSLDTLITEPRPLAESAGSAYWIRNTGPRRLTDIDFSQPSGVT